MIKYLGIAFTYILLITLGIAFWWGGLVLSRNVTGQLPIIKAIAVPFTSQAPQGNWAEPWQNACEETVMVMLTAFYNQYELDQDRAVDEITKMLERRESLVGATKDESMQQVLEVVGSYDLGWSARLVTNPTLEQIKFELAHNRPVIVPIYAPEINNPYYEDGGPDYHTVILTGYNDLTKQFRIHDPGTQRGEAQTFDYTVILNAIHDLNVPDYQAGATTVLFTQHN